MVVFSFSGMSPVRPPTGRVYRRLRNRTQPRTRDGAASRANRGLPALPRCAFTCAGARFAVAVTTLLEYRFRMCAVNRFAVCQPRLCFLDRGQVIRTGGQRPVLAMAPAQRRRWRRGHAHRQPAGFRGVAAGEIAPSGRRSRRDAAHDAAAARVRCAADHRAAGAGVAWLRLAAPVHLPDEYRGAVPPRSDKLSLARERSPGHLVDRLPPMHHQLIYWAAFRRPRDQLRCAAISRLRAGVLPSRLPVAGCRGG